MQILVLEFVDTEQYAESTPTLRFALVQPTLRVIHSVDALGFHRPHPNRSSQYKE